MFDFSFFPFTVDLFHCPLLHLLHLLSMFPLSVFQISIEKKTFTFLFAKGHHHHQEARANKVQEQKKRKATVTTKSQKQSQPAKEQKPPPPPKQSPVSPPPLAVNSRSSRTFGGADFLHILPFWVGLCPSHLLLGGAVFLSPVVCGAAFPPPP